MEEMYESVGNCCNVRPGSTVLLVLQLPGVNCSDACNCLGLMALLAQELQGTDE